MENQQINQSSSVMLKESKNGINSIIAGVFQIFFNSIGPSFLGIIGIVIILINIIAGVRAFKESPQQKKMAIVGLSLSIVMIILGLLGLQISGWVFDYFWNKGF